MTENNKNRSLVRKESSSISRVNKSLEITKKILSDIDIPLFVVLKEHKFGFVDKNRNIVIPFIYDTVPYPNTFLGGLAYVKIDKKYGFINKSGSVVIPFIYEDAGPFYEGLASVSREKKYGFIDKTGKEMIPFLYQYASEFSEGLAGVRFNSNWGFIDKQGEIIIQFQYEYCDPFSEGLASVCKNNKYGFIDKVGKEVIPFKYKSARQFKDGLSFVRKENDIYCVIDISGNEIIQSSFDRDYGINKHNYSFSEGVAAISNNGKWGFIDKMGNEVIPFIYDDAGNFSNGIATVKINNKYGFIDKKGIEIIPFIYDEVIVQNSLFSDGYTMVIYKGKRNYMDRYGNRVFNDI